MTELRDWENPLVTEINRQPAHAPLGAYPDAEMALTCNRTGERTVAGNNVTRTDMRSFRSSSLPRALSTSNNVVTSVGTVTSPPRVLMTRSFPSTLTSEPLTSRQVAGSMTLAAGAAGCVAGGAAAFGVSAARPTLTTASSTMNPDTSIATDFISNSPSGLFSGARTTPASSLRPSTLHFRFPLFAFRFFLSATFTFAHAIIFSAPFAITRPADTRLIHGCSSRNPPLTSDRFPISSVTPVKVTS